MNKLLIHITFCLTGLSASTLLFSQDIYFQRITTEQGLSNNMVTDVLQDEMGFLWFATNNGLNRFDGYGFKEILVEETDSTSLKSNQINSLYMDKEGFLWIASREGIRRMNLSDNSTVHLIKDHKEEISISDNEVISICEDQFGYIWAGTGKGFLNRINKETFEIKRIETGFEKIPSLFYEKPGTIWIGTNRNTLIEFDLSRDTMLVHVNDSYSDAQNPYNEVWFIQKDNQDQLVVGMTSGIYSLNEGTRKFENYLPAMGNLGSFRNNEIRCLSEDEQGKLWIGTWGKGIYIHDPQLNVTNNYRIEPGNSNSLSNNDINFIFRDRTGVTWIGTQDGLDILDPAVKMFNHFQNIPGDPSSLTINYVTAFEEAGPDKMWIGTFGGGINLYDRKKGKFIPFQHDPTDPKSLRNDAVRVIRKDHEGMFWIGTMAGLDRYNPSRNEFSHYLKKAESGDIANIIPGDNIMAILEDSRKNLWVGTYGSGLFSFDKTRSVITVWSGKGNGEKKFTGDYVRAIYEDRKGNIWIGMVENGGLFQFNPYTNEFIHFKADPADSTTISHNNINSIYQDDSGRLWIGTWSGLDLFDFDSRQFRHYTQSDGLPDARIVEIISDLNGNLWVTSHMGLSRIQFIGERSNIINYSLINGVQGNEFNVNAKFRAKSGELYFGGTNGFNVIEPNEVRINTYMPPVVITDFQLFNKSITPHQPYKGRNILTENISYTDTLLLKYSDKVISFEFSALSFSNPFNNRFQYQMEGIDQQWVETNSERRFVTYTNLSPGEYVFRVNASNNDGIWNKDGATLNVIISPPFWETWWAYTAYLLILILVILGIRKVALVRLKLKNDILIERIEKSKIEEINQMKLRFFMNISHEFKTPLTLILGPAEELISNPRPGKDNVRNQLLLIHKNANRLLRLINQLMDFRKIESGALELSVSNGDIISFIKNIVDEFSEFSEKHKIDLAFYSSVEFLDAWFDPDKIEKIIYNLMSNALKFTNDGGKVSLDISLAGRDVIKDEEILHAQEKILKTSGRSAETDSDFILIRVKDTGIGIPQERIPYIFNRFYQIKDSEKLKRKLESEGTGIGLSLTKNLITSCLGEIEVRSKLGEGSEFVVKLPVKSCYFPPQTINEELIDVSKMHYEVSQYLMEKEDTKPTETDPVKEYKEFNENTPVVLIVEDNKELRTFLRYKFEPVYRILEASDGQSGLQIAIENIPDLIVSDIMMPGMDGIELCRKLKKDFITSHIPLILLTAKGAIESKLEGFETGADDYIGKPFNPQLLAVRMRNLIESRRKLRETIRKQLLLEPDIKSDYPTDEKFLEKAVKMVEKNISNSEYNVVEFGNDLNMSRMQIYRKLKALSSLSPNEFIRMIRLKRAAQILRSSNLNVSEVTYEVGFSDPKYFSKCFTKQYGVSPSKYAEK